MHSTFSFLVLKPIHPLAPYPVVVWVGTGVGVGVWKRVGVGAGGTEAEAGWVPGEVQLVNRGGCRGRVGRVAGHTGRAAVDTAVDIKGKYSKKISKKPFIQIN